MKRTSHFEFGGKTRPRRPDRNGAILGVVMVVMVVMSILGVGLMFLGTTDAVETVRDVQKSQVFWLAEAGLHKTASRIVEDPWFREGISRGSGYPTTVGPENVPGVLNGAFRVSVYRGLLGTTESNDFFMTSTGLLPGSAKMVSYTARIITEGYGMPFYSNAITAWSATFNNKTVVTNGPVSVPKENIKDLGGTYTLKDPPDPPPPFDRAPYDTLVNYAASVGVAPPSGPLNLAGGTLYVRGNLSLDDVTGGGTVIASGNVTFGNSKTVEANTTVIAGGQLIFGQGSIVQTNCLLYGGTGVDFKQAGVTISHCALLTPGSIVANQFFTFSGILYAGGSIEIKQGADIAGVVVGGGLDTTADVTLKEGVTMTYDPSVFPSLPPPGLGGLTMVRRDWKEF